MNSFRLSMITAAAMAATLVMALIPAIVAASVPSSQVPDDLEAAIQAKIKAEGQQYAGFCAEIDQAANYGKYCAFVLNLSDNTAEVTYGPVASEPTAHIVFVEEAGRWYHPGGGPGEGEPDPVPDALRMSIGAYIEGKGFSYAGLCSEIAQDGSSIGKHCAVVRDLTDGSATVVYGRVASDETTSVKFTNRSGQWLPAEVESPLWVNDLQYGSGGGGFYWDQVSNQVWTAERGWHYFNPQPVRTVIPLWVNHNGYGSGGGGFYLDPLAGQVWTAERGWHFYSPAATR